MVHRIEHFLRIWVREKQWCAKSSNIILEQNSMVSCYIFHLHNFIVSTLVLTSLTNKILRKPARQLQSRKLSHRSTKICPQVSLLLKTIHCKLAFKTIWLLSYLAVSFGCKQKIHQKKLKSRPSENTDQRKPVPPHLSRSILLNNFRHNLDLRENVSFVSSRKTFLQFKIFQKLEFPDYLLHNIMKEIEVMDYITEHSDCIFWLLSVKLPSFATEHFLIFAFKVSNNHLRGALF